MIARIAVIVLAFVAACASAGITVALALLRSGGPAWPIDVDPEFWMLAFLAASFSGAIILLPLFLLVVLAEAFRLRSVLLYACGGAAVMVFGYFQSGFADLAETEPAQLPIDQEALIAAAAGIVFGFVYWLLAGRKAGAWRTPRPTDAP